ncbi:MepB family protein [Kitasatospora sp. NBC_00240]|uniref:MepB family protein n=1 Tax=Kitasatospora sp. NBC_00240 TaxID=2903567 RepID=UPI0022514099|nr:MepB family protein [Kitasatospora sp. NBC_00240]MCX5214182.1 MepB family protein [Kitasatospora sp. NBC_00240]
MRTKHADPAGPRPAAAGAWPAGGPLPADLLAAKALVYDPAGFVCGRPEAEPESADYGAHAFTLDGYAVRFRVARTTPTKAGQFVTLWQRSAAGPIRPFDLADPVDLFVVSSREGDRFGQFVLPKEVLRRRGIVSAGGSGGKRAFRVYPPWAVTTSRQAVATQAWQAEYFLPVGPAAVDTGRARELHRP